MPPIRIGLLGAGAMGAEHAWCYGLIEGVELAGVFSRDPARAAALASRSGARATAAATSLVDDPAIDAIDVCLPTPAHAGAVVRALEHGKHVFCETPLTLDPAQARRMRDAARAAGRLLQVGLLTRSIGACARVKRAVETVEHGRLLSLTTHRLGSYLRAGAPDHKAHYSDPSTELMTFDFDFALWLLGPPRRLVASAVSTPHGLGEISALLDFDDGRAATILASGLMPGPCPFRVGFRALFETALIESEAVFPQAGPPDVSLRLYPQAGDPRSPDIPATNPYQVELERFIACIRGAADPALLDVDNALSALTLSIATQTSLRERRPVELG